MKTEYQIKKYKKGKKIVIEFRYGCHVRDFIMNQKEFDLLVDLCVNHKFQDISKVSGLNWKKVVNESKERYDNIIKVVRNDNPFSVK